VREFLDFGVFSFFEDLGECLRLDFGFPVSLGRCVDCTCICLCRMLVLG